MTNDPRTLILGEKAYVTTKNKDVLVRTLVGVLFDDDMCAETPWCRMAFSPRQEVQNVRFFRLGKPDFRTKAKDSNVSTSSIAWKKNRRRPIVGVTGGCR